MTIKQRDLVRVIGGAERGRTGKVIMVLPKANRLVVEKVRMIKRSRKARTGRPGGIIEQEASIAASQVMLICPKCEKATRQASGQKGLRRCTHCQHQF